MTLYSIENIVDFVKETSGEYNITKDSRIFEDVGLNGDDFLEFIEKYSLKVNVDMSDYLWYFHTNEEGGSIGGLFFNPPYKRVKRIPVTLYMLLNFANKGKWEIAYPEHKLPKRRYDILINQILFGGLLLWFLIWLVRKLY